MARMSRRPPDRGRRSPYTAFNQKIETSPLLSGFHRDGALEDHLLHAVNIWRQPSNAQLRSSSIVIVCRQKGRCFYAKLCWRTVRRKHNGWNFLFREEIILTEAKNVGNFTWSRSLLEPKAKSAHLVFNHAPRFSTLCREALHGAVGTEDTAISPLRHHSHMTVIAFVEEQALIDWNRCSLLMLAIRAG